MPWTKNTAVTARRARRVPRGRRGRGTRVPTASGAPYVDTSASQVCNSLFVGFAVGDQDVNHSDVADVPERHPTDLRSVSDCNDSTRGACGGSFDNGFGQVVGGDAGSHIEPAEAHDVGVKAQLCKGIAREIADK